MLQITPPLAPNASQQFKSSKQKAIYYGRDLQTGGFRFKDSDGQKCIVIGAAYEIVTSTDVTGKSKKKRELIAKTPGWEATPETDVSFIAIELKTRNRIRLIGTVQVLPVTAIPTVSPLQLKAPPNIEVVAATEPMPKAEQQMSDMSQKCALPPTTVDSDCDKQVSQTLALAEEKLAAFKSELEVINAQRASGLDPIVSIPTMEIMSKRSHASIYRDVKKNVLPKPTKVGSRSFFPLSVVLAYIAGQVHGGAAPATIKNSTHQLGSAQCKAMSEATCDGK